MTSLLRHAIVVLIILFVALLSWAVFDGGRPQGPEQRMHDALGGVR